MTSLHELTENIKNLIKWLLIGVAGLFVLYLLFQGVIILKNMFFPPPPNAPKVAFGKLEPIPFPTNNVNESFTYAIDTTTGTLGTFPDKVLVFKTVPPSPSLFNLQRAKEKIEVLDFVKSFGAEVVPEIAQSASVYEWDDETDLPRKVTMDIVTFDFAIESPFLTYPNILTAQNLPNEANAIEYVRSILANISLIPEDIDEAKTRIEKLTIQDGKLIAATSLASTHVMRVDFFQKDLNKMKLVYPHPPYSIMNFFVASGGTKPEIVQANFSYQKIGEDATTYPIKTPEQAFAELKEGKAYIASYFGTGNDISITNIYLAYYLGEKKQKFLIPVVVFEGNDGFFAYVSAVTDNWVE